MLGYPEKNIPKSTELNSCSQPHVKTKFLLFLTWLAELVDYIDELRGQTEKITTEIFIRDLCSSKDPKSMLAGPGYFSFCAQLYDDFLKLPEEAALKE